MIAYVRDVERAPELTQFLEQRQLKVPFNFPSVRLAELVFWLMSNYSSETPWFDQIERMVLAGETVVKHWCPAQTKDICRTTSIPSSCPTRSTARWRPTT